MVQDHQLQTHVECDRLVHTWILLLILRLLCMFNCCATFKEYTPFLFSASQNLKNGSTQHFFSFIWIYKIWWKLYLYKQASLLMRFFSDEKSIGHEINLVWPSDVKIRSFMWSKGWPYYFWETSVLRTPATWCPNEMASIGEIPSVVLGPNIWTDCYF